MSSIGNDLGDHTLVTVTAGHLVTRLHATLHSQVNLDHFQHASRQLVCWVSLALVFKGLVGSGGSAPASSLIGFQLVGRIAVFGRMSNQWNLSTEAR